MCGIVGVLVRDAERLPDLSAALHALAHRGPDGEGLASESIVGSGAIAFGHRRLSIIDLSDEASQPMQDTSGRYQLIFNGEIYNYIEVRNDLRALGVQFRTVSDSEVILEAYKRWGNDCLLHLNGMFALAILDRRNETIFCARDRYGEKPFLYAAKPEFFAFASEYKALLTLPGISTAHDEFRLLLAAHDQSFGLDADRQTVFNDIQQLLPGEAMEVCARTFKRRQWRYYEPKPSILRKTANEQDVFAEFRALLVDSVRLRMRSDVKVGSCLSGGLDSSSIVCIVRDLLGADAEYHTFTGRFPGTYADEFAYASAVAEATGVRSHVVEPTVDRFVDELPEFMWHNELPVGSSSQYAQWCVFRLAKEHGVTVLLDGQGADELLGGYEQYFTHYVATLKEAGEIERLDRELPLIKERYPLALQTGGRAWSNRIPLSVRHVLANRLGIGTNLLYAFAPDVAQKLSSAGARPRLPGFCSLGSALAFDSFSGFLPTLLRYGDRNSMAHSREVRLPFCDHRLAEFVFSVPPHILMGDIQTKRLLRESMRGLLPESIRSRWNKQGFRPPQDIWFASKKMNTLLRDTLSSQSFRASPFWKSSAIQKMLDRHDRGEQFLSWVLWHPFMIEMWRTHFLNRSVMANA